MTTERERPSLTLTLVLGPRGDVRWSIEEGTAPIRPLYPGTPSGWAEPDLVERVVRRELPIAIATWNHRWRRAMALEDPDLPA